MIKRLLDIVIASIALILLSPLYFIVARKVKKNLGSPVLFRQVRPGLHGKPFEMIKFRTMKDAVDANGNPLPDSEPLRRRAALPDHRTFLPVQEYVGQRS